jgi:sporulation integral membrane protein YtvI
MVNINNRTKLLYVIIVTIIGVYFGFQYILPLFTPFIIAYLLSRPIIPIARFLNYRLRIPKLLGGILSLAFFGTIIVKVGCYFIEVLIKQILILLQNIPIYLSILSIYLERVCNGCDKFFGIQFGSARGLIDSNMDGVLSKIKTEIIPAITSQSLYIAVGIVGAIGVILITIITILLLIKDEDEYKRSFQSMTFYSDVHLITNKLSETGIAYLRTQAIIMLLVALVCTTGFLLMKNKYALLIGIGIGIFDAFPILGSGLILIPWSIISLLSKDIFSAAVLMTLYLGCQILRQFIEPKLLGNRIGIKPVYTFMSMYVGLKLFGFAGFLLGPLGLVIILAIIKESEERLIGKVKIPSE